MRIQAVAAVVIALDGVLGILRAVKGHGEVGIAYGLDDVSAGFGGGEIEFTPPETPCSSGKD